MDNRLKGAFYTPKEVASWMSERALLHANSTNSRERKLRILEPSCGDGVFLQTLAQYSKVLVELDVDAIELDEEALEKAKKMAPLSNFYQSDFLLWENQYKYNIILGNPPYISRKFLTTQQAAICKEIHINHGLSDKKIFNIWTAFLLRCSSMLCDKGVLAFVLPTELLQVNFSNEIRQFLLDNFERVEIISFRNLAFETLEQDTVILFAYKKALSKGLYFSEVNSIDDLSDTTILFAEHYSSQSFKWSSYVLSQDDICFIDDLLTRCNLVSDYCSSVAGIVTAANNYFIISQRTAEQYSLQPYTKPIVERGLYVNGSAQLSLEDYDNLRLRGKPCYLLDLTNISEEKFSSGLQEYIELGQSQKIPSRYKCKLRKRWYDVPSVWKSEGFFFKRGHNYVKLLVNHADVYVTDSAYRIAMKEKYDIRNLTISFYNSLTLLCSELFGRYYGGGVLEVTPNEFKKLPLPYVEKACNYDVFINSFENKSSIEDFLSEHDKKILSSIKGITENDIDRVHNIYKRVKNRRLRRET